MSHADAVREAEKRVLDAADAMLDEGAHELRPWSECCRRDCSRCATDSALYRAAGELRALRAATCPRCDGLGEDYHAGFVPRCPANCNEGRQAR